MQYQGQQNEIEMSIPNGKLTDDNIEDLTRRFEAEYEGRYSPTARVPQAPLEILSLRSTIKCIVEKYDRATTTESGANPTEAAVKSPRKVYLDEERGQIEVPVYNGTELQPGNELEGPVIIDMPDTSIVAHENQSVSVNKYSDFKIEVN
jgi:N-methylhydantoinase A